MWQNMKIKFRQFMSTRSGADNLSLAELGCALVLSILGMILASNGGTVTRTIGSVVNILGFALYIHCIFRMFSSNKEKRREENRKYMAATDKARTNAAQAVKRFKNRKEYKYFRCPNCKVRMRLKRGAGIVTVTCRQCQNSFTQKS